MREDIDEFDAYLNHLAQALAHADRHAGLKGPCSALVLPLSRKSVEPMAAHIDALHASAKHQSVHHFVAKWTGRTGWSCSGYANG
jgi:SRSO17 transposase